MRLPIEVRHEAVFELAKPIRRICSARHGFLYMSQDRDSDLLKTMGVMATRAERRASSARNRRRCVAAGADCLSRRRLARG